MEDINIIDYIFCPVYAHSKKSYFTKFFFFFFTKLTPQKNITKNKSIKSKRLFICPGCLTITTQYLHS